MVFFFSTTTTPQIVIAADNETISPGLVASVDPTHDPHDAANPIDASGVHTIKGGLIEIFSVYISLDIVY